MKRKMLAGTTSVTLPIFIGDTSSTTGGGLASLVYNSSGLTAKYRRQGESSWTSITLATATLGTFTSGGFIADNAGVAGTYEFGVPDAAVASGVRWVAIHIYGATNMLPVLIEIELDAINYQDSVRAGLTALPNAAAEASGGLITRGSSAGQLNVSSGKAPATIAVGDIANAAITAAVIATDAIDADAIAADAVTELQSGLATASTLTTVAGYIDTEVAAIKAKTDNLPTDPADQSAIEAAITAATSGLSTLTTSDIDARLTAYDAATGTEAAAISSAIAALPSASAISSAVWSAVTRTLTSGGGTTPAEVWNYLTSSISTTGSIGKLLKDNIDAAISDTILTLAASNPASVDSATINIHAASSYSGTLTGLTIPVSWTSAVLTMKRKTAHADSKSVLQILVTNGSDAGDGLVILNGSTTTTKTDASLSVNQGAGSITVTIADAATAALAVESYRYDVKIYYGDSSSIATAEATVNVTSAVTLAT